MDYELIQLTPDGEKEIARKAYNAYGDDASWLTFDGRPMPEWDNLSDAVQSHWAAAVWGVIRHFQIRPA